MLVVPFAHSHFLFLRCLYTSSPSLSKSHFHPPSFFAASFISLAVYSLPTTLFSPFSLVLISRRVNPARPSSSPITKHIRAHSSRDTRPRYNDPPYVLSCQREKKKTKKSKSTRRFDDVTSRRRPFLLPLAILSVDIKALRPGPSRAYVHLT